MAQSELEKKNSSSAEGEDLSSEGSESESDPEKTPPHPSSKKTPDTPKFSSGRSESESELPPKTSGKADPSIKPLASVPMDDAPNKKSRPKKPTSRYSPPPAKPITGKRKAAEVESEGRESKIANEKGPVAVENAGEKKPLFQRLWSEDDEIDLIKGMINYAEKKGKDPTADVTDFHEFVKNSLNIDVNNAQMSAKVKRLKAKFMNNVGRIELKGKVRSLSNPHEKKMYELSEKLWGGISNSNKKKNKTTLVSCSIKAVDAKPKTNEKGKDKKAVVLSEVKVNVAEIRFPITDEDIMKKGLESLSGPKKVELEEKWHNLKMQELKHYLKKLKLMQEQTELLLSAIEKSGAC